jgi:hypothetical protein
LRYRLIVFLLRDLELLLIILYYFLQDKMDYFVFLKLKIKIQKERRIRKVSKSLFQMKFSFKKQKEINSKQILSI